MTLYKWSQTASSDATADSTINWAEGQAPSSVNDSARAMMAATAKYRDDIAGAIVTSGTSTAYTVSSYEVFDTLAHLGGQMIAFTPHITNGATVTLNVDSLGAKPLRSAPGVELLAGTIIQGTPYMATYNNSDGAFYLQGFFGNPYNVPLLGGLDFWDTIAPNSSFIFPAGQAISRATYSAAFARWGTTYGAGDGSTTFNVPDKTGRVSAMKEATATRLTAATVGVDGGTMGSAGGGSQTLVLANLPPITPSGTITNGAITLTGGRMPLASPDLAMLRQAADVLPALAEAAAGPDLASWLLEHREEIETLVNRLSPPAVGQDNQVSQRDKPVGTEAPPSQRDKPAGSLTPVLAVAAVPAPVPEREAEQVVRVAAQSLTRLMGLAGEALVQARWLQPFAQLLLRLKRRQARLVDTLDELSQALPPGAANLLAEVRQGLTTCHGELDDRIGEFEDHAREADNLNSRLYHEVIASRMRPFSDGTHGFPRLVRDLARQLGKKVRFEVVGETTEVDRDVLEKLEAPLNHLVRNALDHGLETPEQRQSSGKSETGLLCLEARHNAGMLSIQVRDDGRGIALDRIRRKVVERKPAAPDMAADFRDDELLEFLFLPGFSTAEQVTQVSGRGVGLDVVRSMVHAVGGTVRIHSQPGRGTTFHLQLPITLSVIRAVLTEIADEPYAFPHNRINRLLRLPRAELGSLQDRQFFAVDGRNVGIVLARQLFELGGELPPGDDLFVVLFGEPPQEHGLVVDRFIGEQDLVVRPLDARLGPSPNISAAAILEDGSPVLIVDVDDLGRSIQKLLQGSRLQRADRPTGLPERSRRRVLVVDDSITVREVQRQLLLGRGYDVEVAVDGMDGWNMVRRGGFDLVVSDVDMPRLDGLGLVRLIKSDPQLQSTPVVIVSYKDQEEHRLAGLEAGANYYLTKSSFHDATFLTAVEDLIGGPDS